MKLVFFNHRHAAAEAQAPGGMFAGTVGEYARQAAVRPPRHATCSTTTTTTTTGRARSCPIYPASKDVSSWVIQKSVKLLLGAGGGFGDLVDDPLPEDIRARHGLLSLAAALLDIHRPDHAWRTSSAPPHRLKWDEALTLQLTLAARRRAAALEPGIARPRAVRRPARRRRRRAARSTSPRASARWGRSSPPSSTATSPCTGCCRARSARARPSSRCGPWPRSSTPAARPRCWPRPRCSPPSTPAASAQLLGPLGRAGELDGDPAGTRVTLLTGSLKAAAQAGGPRRGRRRPRRHRRRHPRAAAGGRRLRRPRPRRRRRAAPVRRRAARRPARQGQPPAARPGHDRDAHPAHRRHDRLRRPGDLHAAPAAQRPRRRRPAPSSRWGRSPPGSTAPGSGSARRSPPAGRPTSSARGSATTTGADDEPEDADGAPDDGPRSDRRPPLAVLDIAELLRSGPLAGLRLDVLHGRLTPEEKDARMRAFAAREIDVLVATTVVEVGVDVPERHGDGRHGRRPVRRQPAAPAARPRRPREARRALPAGHRGADGVAHRAAARRRRRHLRRLRAGPPRPRDPARGRRPRRRAVRHAARASGCSRCSRTRSSSPPPAPRPPRCWRPSAGSPTTRASPPRSPPWPPTSARTGWRRRDHHPMTRLISGVAGGRRLKVPRTGVRPTGDRAREALFNSLEARCSTSGAPPCSTCTPAPAPSAWRRCRAGPASVVFVESVAAACCPCSRTTSPPSGCPGGRVVAGSVPTVVARRAAGPVRPRARRPALRDAGRGGARTCSARWSAAAGWRPARSWWSSGRAGRSPGSGRHP